MIAHRAAFLEGFAGLLNKKAHVRYGRNHAQSVMLSPAAISIGCQLFVRFQLGGDKTDAGDISIRIGTYFHLELAKSLFRQAASFPAIAS